MKVKYASIFTIVLVLVSGVPLFSGPGVINNANARYAPANTQTQANSNECDTGSNCAINSPQTQGDGTANSPTNLQISRFNEDQAGEPSTGMPVDLVVSNCQGRIQVDCQINNGGPRIRLVCPTDGSHTCRTYGMGGFRLPDLNCDPIPRPIPESQPIHCTGVV